MQNKRKQFPVMLTEDERYMLLQIAKRRGVSAADVLRMGIMDAYVSLGLQREGAR